MDMKGSNIIIAFFCFFLFFSSPSYSQTDSLSKGQQLRHGEYLLSDFDICKLGFFDTGGQSQNRFYLGIWYNQPEEKPVWVANPDTPIFNLSATLTLDMDGWLKISYNGSNATIVTLNSIRAAGNAIATLHNDGNFVLKELNSDGSTKQVLWQSFDHPTDTLLPGMKLGFDLNSGKTWFLRSWLTVDFPQTGSFSLGIDPNGSSQLIIWRRGIIYWTSGQWIDGNFRYTNSLSELYKFSFVSNETHKYFFYTVSRDITIFPKLTITSSGELRAYKRTYPYPDISIVYLRCPDIYSRCSFMKPYERIFVSCDYDDYTQGCAGQKLPECRKSWSPYYSYTEPTDTLITGDGFKLENSENMTMMDCKAECLNNCSCIACAPSNDDGTGCQLWSSIPEAKHSYDSENSKPVYYVGNTGAGGPYYEEHHVPDNLWKWIVIPLGGVLATLLLCVINYFIWRRRTEIVLMLRDKKREIVQLLRSLHDSMWQKLKAAAENKVNQMLSYELGHDNADDEKDGKPSEWKLFSFSSIITATDNFSCANKLGEGGFGPVYKGILLEGQEVAIKRLSRSSGQGLVEFKNEITLIAKLQHTNLVRLLGCCIRGEEKILVYEYMHNKSLDSFLSDPSKKTLLDWGKRVRIVEGIAQGLIYLHKYSRLRIIHRDLKASNFLLDNEMNPKISDFGLARIFELHESEANTKRVVGTYGYMSPEYAMQGIVSVKIDVFSFGVLLLEIVSGKKNNSFYHYERPMNLVGYAWELWREDRAMELVDPTVIETCPGNEGLRCIHVGLLCVQDHAEDRPTMTDVVAMLSNETMQLNAPKQPAFFIKMDDHIAQIAENNCEDFTLCNVSISEMEAR